MSSASWGTKHSQPERDLDPRALQCQKNNLQRRLPTVFFRFLSSQRIRKHIPRTEQVKSKTCHLSVVFMNFAGWMNLQIFYEYFRTGLSMKPKLAWNLKSSCLSLKKKRITGVNHYVWILSRKFSSKAMISICL